MSFHQSIPLPQYAIHSCLQYKRLYQLISHFISILFLLSYISTSHATTMTPTTSTAQSLSHFPKAESSWGKHLNPQNHIPNTGFDAYYLNRNDLKTIVAKENVPHIAINYAYQDFHRIDSKNFSAYWVGKLRVPKDAAYQFSVDLSWAQVRIVLNGHVILNAANYAPNKTVYLPAGDYVMEVQYSNHWHTVGFQAKAAPVDLSVPTHDLPRALAKLNPPANTVVYLASVYESNHKNNQITLKAHQINRPYILILDSHNAVNWQATDLPKPIAIVQTGNISSHIHATGNPPIMLSHESFDHYTDEVKDIANSCSCISGRFSCSENMNLGLLAKKVHQQTGFPLVGVSGMYETETLTVPEKTIDSTVIRQAETEFAKQEQLCKQKSHSTQW